MRHQEVDDLRQQPLHARMQGLEGQVAGVGVHHQARKAVRLPVDQPVGVGVGHHPPPIVQGPLEAAPPKSRDLPVRRRRSQTAGRCGTRRCKRPVPGKRPWGSATATRSPARNLRQACFQIIPVDPGVAGAVPPESLGRQAHRRQMAGTRCFVLHASPRYLV